MQLLINLAIFIVAVFLIMKTADMFVKGAVEISLAVKLQKVFIAATVVSLVTTLPEFIVSVSASYIGQAGMAVGNAIGSCISNIGCILAVGAIIKDITVEKEDFMQRMSALFASLLIIYLSALDGKIDRTEAMIILVFLGMYLLYSYMLARKIKKDLEKELEDKKKILEIKEEEGNVRQGLNLLLAGGILTVAIARYGLVDPGINIANFLRIPPIVIGLTLIALGTSLPELFTAIASSRGKHGEVALGNVIGANILNLLWVLGFAALVRPLTIDSQTIFFNLPFAFLITSVMFLLGLSGLKINRKMGLFLLCMYIAYIIVVYLFVYRGA